MQEKYATIVIASAARRASIPQELRQQPIQYDADAGKYSVQFQTELRPTLAAVEISQIAEIMSDQGLCLARRQVERLRSFRLREGIGVDKFLDLISKAKFSVVFLALGALFALVAAAETLKIYGIEFTPYGRTAHVALGLLGLASLGFGVFLVLRDGGASEDAFNPNVGASKPKYDVFLAAPMASVETEAEYQAIRELCLQVLALMRAHCGVKTWYFVGEKLETQASFESCDVAAEIDFDAIGASRNFVLIYPRKAASSVLAEAGFALARNCPGSPSIS